MAIVKLWELGVIIEEIYCFWFCFGIVVYYVIVFFEVLVNLVCYDVVCYGLWVEVDNLMEMYIYIRVKGFGVEVKWCIMFGIYVLFVGYYDVYYFKV